MKHAGRDVCSVHVTNYALIAITVLSVLVCAGLDPAEGSSGQHRKLVCQMSTLLFSPVVLTLIAESPLLLLSGEASAASIRPAQSSAWRFH